MKHVWSFLAAAFGLAAMVLFYFSGKPEQAALVFFWLATALAAFAMIDTLLARLKRQGEQIVAMKNTMRNVLRELRAGQLAGAKDMLERRLEEYEAEE